MDGIHEVTGSIPVSSNYVSSESFLFVQLPYTSDYQKGMYMNKLVAYLVLFGIISALHGMRSDLIITQLYPPFSKRHKEKIDNIKAGAIALLSSGAAFAGKKYLGLPISTGLHIAIPLMSFGAAVLWQKHQKQKNPKQLVDLLLTNPQKVLDYMEFVAPEFQSGSEGATTDKLAREYEQSKEDYEKRCPIFLLRECQGNYCPLSRNNTSCRKTFETKMTDVLLEKLNSRTDQNQVEHVSFASGRLFQDLVILTKVLAKKPDATMSVHFIDLQYEVPHIINVFMKRSPEISTADSDNSLPEKTEELMRIIDKHFPASENKDSDENIYNRLCGAYTIWQGMGCNLHDGQRRHFQIRIYVSIFIRIKIGI